MQFATGYTATRFFTKSLAEALSNHDTSFGLLGPEIGSWYEGGGLVFAHDEGKGRLRER